MCRLWMSSAESADEPSCRPAAVRVGDRDPGHPRCRCAAAGASARLQAHRSAQRVCDLSHIPRGSVAACRAPRERHLSVRRRSQRRLRRARHLRRLHDQRLQRELHRARDRNRPANAAHLRFYHAMYQALMFAMNLGLLANNIGLMWVAIEMATLTTVLMVGIYRTHEALEAAWKYFILGSVGIALALFGTILVYMAARPVIGEGLDAMVWTVLMTRGGAFDPALLNVAFVFLLLGYGTKVGLAPLYAWLPDAHAEGPTPISAVLSGLLLN